MGYCCIIQAYLNSLVRMNTEIGNRLENGVNVLQDLRDSVSEPYCGIVQSWSLINGVCIFMLSVFSCKCRDSLWQRPATTKKPLYSHILHISQWYVPDLQNSLNVDPSDDLTCRGWTLHYGGQWDFTQCCYMFSNCLHSCVPVLSRFLYFFCTNRVGPFSHPHNVAHAAIVQGSSVGQLKEYL